MIKNGGSFRFSASAKRSSTEAYAFAAATAAYYTGNPWIGFIAGGIFGVLLSFPVTGLIRNVFLRIGIVSKYPAVFYPHPLLIDCIVFAAITVMVLIVTTFIANSLLSGPLISAGKEESGQPLTISTFRIAAGSALLFGGTAMLLLVSFNGRNGIGMSFLTSCFFLAGIIFFHR